MANNGLRVGSVTPRLFQTVTVSPALINANSLSVETYTVNGLQTDMITLTHQQITQAGIVLLHSRVSAANTLEVTWFNGTSGSITPTAGQFLDLVAF